jgi:hypothetical protein
MSLNNKKKDNENERISYYPYPKSNWKKYHVYYLVLGSFFVTILIILISNISTNKKIRQINDRLDGKTYSSFGLGYSSKMADYSSRLESEPFPSYVKEKVKEEIEKIQGGSLSGQTKESREE